MNGPLRTLDALDRRLIPGLARRPELAVVLLGALFLGAGLARVVIVSEQAQPPPVEVVTIAPVAPEQRVPPADDPVVQGPPAFPVGPAQGIDVEAYVAQRRAVLDAAAAAEDAAAPTVAIVSFERYLTPADAAAVSVPVRPFAVRYRLPVDDPFVGDALSALTRGRVGIDVGILGSLLPALQDLAERARSQAADLEGAPAGGPDAALRNRLLAAGALVGPSGCACVYALEVQGTVGELRALADDEAVRLVDIAPPGARAGAIAFTALLPEERGAVGGPPAEGEP
jgi:hypothetical protein